MQLPQKDDLRLEEVQEPQLLRSMAFFHAMRKKRIFFFQKKRVFFQGKNSRMLKNVVFWEEDLF